LKLNPRHQTSLEGIAELYLWAFNQRDKAKPHIEQLEELYPTSPRTWDLSAQLYAGMDDIKQRYALRRYLAVVDKDAANEKDCIERSKAQLLVLERKLQQAGPGAAAH